MARALTRQSLASARSQAKPVHLGFVVDKVALGLIFLLSTLVSPCQCRSTIAQYSALSCINDVL